MPQPASPRLGLVGPSGTDLISQGDDVIRAIIARLDTVVAPVLSGTLAARPTSTPGTPGIIDRIYFATDTVQAFRDTGTGWVEIARAAQGAFRRYLSSSIALLIARGNAIELDTEDYDADGVSSIDVPFSAPYDCVVQAHLQIEFVGALPSGKWLRPRIIRTEADSSGRTALAAGPRIEGPTAFAPGCQASWQGRLASGQRLFGDIDAGDAEAYTLDGGRSLTFFEGRIVGRY